MQSFIKILFVAILLSSKNSNTAGLDVGGFSKENITTLAVNNVVKYTNGVEKINQPFLSKVNNLNKALLINTNSLKNDIAQYSSLANKVSESEDDKAEDIFYQLVDSKLPKEIVLKVFYCALDESNFLDLKKLRYINKETCLKLDLYFNNWVKNLNSTLAWINHSLCFKYPNLSTKVYAKYFGFYNEFLCLLPGEEEEKRKKVVNELVTHKHFKPHIILNHRNQYELLSCDYQYTLLMHAIRLQDVESVHTLIARGCNITFDELFYYIFNQYRYNSNMYGDFYSGLNAFEKDENKICLLIRNAVNTESFKQSCINNLDNTNHFIFQNLDNEMAIKTLKTLLFLVNNKQFIIPKEAAHSLLLNISHFLFKPLRFFKKGLSEAQNPSNKKYNYYKGCLRSPDFEMWGYVWGYWNWYPHEKEAINEVFTIYRKMYNDICKNPLYTHEFWSCLFSKIDENFHK